MGTNSPIYYNVYILVFEAVEGSGTIDASELQFSIAITKGLLEIEGDLNHEIHIVGLLKLVHARKILFII